jgi:hypothetical protein
LFLTGFSPDFKVSVDFIDNYTGGSKESEAIAAVTADGRILAADPCKLFQFKILIPC